MFVWFYVCLRICVGCLLDVVGLLLGWVVGGFVVYLFVTLGLFVLVLLFGLVTLSDLCCGYYRLFGLVVFGLGCFGVVNCFCAFASIV